MDQQTRATEHVAAGLDGNVARSHSIENARDIDEKAAISEHVEDSTLDPISALNDPDFAAKEKALVRRLDMTFIPCLWILYFHNYLDRNNIAQARLSTFEEDLNLPEGGFNSAISILTAGYMIGQIPSNMLLTRMRPGLYLSGCAFVWSCLSAATAGVTDLNTLLVVRFFLGLAEAPFFPGAVFCLSAWYTRGEIARRVTCMYVALCVAMGSSGLIAAGVFGNLHGAMGLSGWQWLFIIESATGAFFALTGPFFIPDFPGSKTGAGVYWLSDDLRKVAMARIAADRVSEPQANQGVWYGLRLALTDIKTWGFIALNISISCAFGFNNFYPTIVRALDMGSTTITTLLTAPPYFMTAFTAMAVAWHSDRKKERGWHLTGPMIVTVIGYIISVATLNNAARYFASFLYIGGSFSANPLVISWAVSTLGRTPKKRAAGTAVVNVFGFIGNLVTPFFFPESHEPRYLMAMLLMMAWSVVTVSCALFLKWLLKRGNKQLRAKSDEDGTPYVPYTT